MRIYKGRFTKEEKLLFALPALVACAFCIAKSIQSIIPQRLWGHSAPVSAVAFSGDGKFLASGSQDGNVFLWDTASNSRVKAMACGQPVVSLSFSPDGSELAASGMKGQVFLWDIASGAITKTWKAHNAMTLLVRISPDNRLIATTCVDFGIKVWDKKSGRLIKELRKGLGNKEYVCLVPVDFSPSGALMATAIGTKGTIQLWDTRTFRRAREIQVPYVTEPGQESYYQIGCLCFSPDGSSVAYSYSDTGIVDLTTGKRVFTTDYASQNVRFLPGGKKLVCDSDTETKIIELLTGKTVHLAHPDGALSVDALAVSPDGQRIAVGVFDTNEVFLRRLKPDFAILK